MSESEASSLGAVLITGGCGYVGMRLAEHLATTFHQPPTRIILLDVRPPPPNALAALNSPVPSPSSFPNPNTHHRTHTPSPFENTPSAASSDASADSQQHESAFPDQDPSAFIFTRTTNTRSSTRAAAAAAAAAAILAATSSQTSGNLLTTFPHQPTRPLITFCPADLRDAVSVSEALRGIDTVFHVASYGMSGRESYDHALIEVINVTGTHNIIAGCLEQGVTRLVYCSSYNSVFIGQPIYNGTETFPAWPIPAAHYTDAYSRTKAAAEVAVIKANGSKCIGKSCGTTEDPAMVAITAAAMGVSDWISAPASPHTASGAKTLILRTASIRPPGIYGPGEQRHMPRVLGYARQGLFSFIFGATDSLSDWCHVDNLVQGLELAAVGLTERKHHIAAGQCYFVSDNNPINNFEFFRPIIEGLGYTFPTIWVPFQVVLGAAMAFELVYARLLLLGVQVWDPLLSRVEVIKSAVHHTFSVEKAQTQLGYVPVLYDFNDIVEWYREAGFARYSKKSLPPLTDFTLQHSGSATSLSSSSRSGSVSPTSSTSGSILPVARSGFRSGISSGAAGMAVIGVAAAAVAFVSRQPPAVFAGDAGAVVERLLAGWAPMLLHFKSVQWLAGGQHLHALLLVVGFLAMLLGVILMKVSTRKSQCKC